MRAKRTNQARIPPEVRTDLALILARLTREMTVWGMARRLLIDQPKASTLRYGRVESFSAERLIVFATRLGCDVEIRVHPPPYFPHPGPRTGRWTPHQGTIRVVDDTAGRAVGCFR